MCVGGWGGVQETTGGAVRRRKHLRFFLFRFPLPFFLTDVQMMCHRGAFFWRGEVQNELLPFVLPLPYLARQLSPIPSAFLAASVCATMPTVCHSPFVCCTISPTINQDVFCAPVTHAPHTLLSFPPLSFSLPVFALPPNTIGFLAQ